MSVTVTSLTHPTMIAKIRQGLRYAALGQGHKMNGHGKRVYIENRKGHNIIRINWLGNGTFIAWGDNSKDVTDIVKAALRRANVKPVHTYSDDTLSPEAIAKVQANPDLMARLGKLATLAGLSLAVTGCSSSGAMTAFYSVLGSLFA
ncbi:hypothetical protein [Pseudomonas phage COT4]|uniref:Uncharacterized protein n=1 Tax=Pseudomonas phage M5.1 TaxID=2873460 RepID=A0AAE8XFU7_9CAUD|nr:hypothetical protein QGX13_gp055 [Pseudomonas phage M5.1]UAV89768.1 hypothetical protein M51_187 [Pseudomonas phage M5.1]UGL61367.1 hypothetical protein [Pseudomonas phage COT4]